MSTNSIQRKAISVLLVALGLHFVTFGTVFADTPQQIIVTAPLFSVKVDTWRPPAEGYNLDLTLINSRDSVVEAEFRLLEGPEGWKASVFKRVESLVVDRIMLLPNSRDTSLNFHFLVPEGTRNGDYVFRVGLFEGSRMLDDVEYTVTVDVPPDAKPSALKKALEINLPGGFEFDSRFSNVKISLGGEATFPLSLRSRDVRPLTFVLESSAPDGWQVYYKPAYQNASVAALSLKGGGFKDFDIKITPPVNAEPGTHSILLRGIVDGLEPVELPLTIELMGVADVNLSPADGRLTSHVTAGIASEVVVFVTNSGTESVDNVRFVAEAPPEWTVTLSENPLARIEAKHTLQLLMNIEAPEDTIPGDYNLRLVTAVAGQAVDLKFRITVVRSSSFGFIGVGIILAVVSGLITLFVRSGRR